MPIFKLTFSRETSTRDSIFSLHLNWSFQNFLSISCFEFFLRGKIIHVTRDPRAVAVSAYPFLGAMDHWKEYYKMWDFKSADDFARHDVDGHLFWGCVKKYDEEWKKAAEERGYDYLFVKFEDIIR